MFSHRGATAEQEKNEIKPKLWFYLVSSARESRMYAGQ